MNSLHISLQAKPILAAPGASFTRLHTCRYASSQELAPSTHQNNFYYLEGNI